MPGDAAISSMALDRLEDQDAPVQSEVLGSREAAHDFLGAEHQTDFPIEGVKGVPIAMDVVEGRREGRFRDLHRSGVLHASCRAWISCPFAQIARGRRGDCGSTDTAFAAV